jgi:hypothetical protein
MGPARIALRSVTPSTNCITINSLPSEECDRSGARSVALGCWRCTAVFGPAATTAPTFPLREVVSAAT